MSDFLSEMRQLTIDNFQFSMRAIRLLMGYSVNELAEYIGVTRQTINNLETGKSKMSATQFLSLAAVVDNYTQSNGELYQAIESVLDGNGKRMSKEYDTSFSACSLLKRWFQLFDSAEIKNSVDLYADSIIDEQQVGQLVWRYKIFVDADVLIEKNSERFFMMLGEKLVQNKERLILPLKAIALIQELTCNPKESSNAIRALKLINGMQQKGVVQIRGEESDPELHDTILAVFEKFRKMYRLCIITQNQLFAHEALQMNYSNEGGFDVIACYLNDKGELSLYSDRKEWEQDEKIDGFEKNEAKATSIIESPIGWEML